jgi:predicted lysophospholipase L1 biosynthesis ABC-type transport system permease subunit
MQYLIDHSTQIAEILAGIAAVVVAVIALTPSKVDDEALTGFLARISPTRKAVGSIAALSALFLGGCAGVKVPVEDARAVACIAVERSFVDRDDAELRVAITRAVCDELHRRMVGE